MDYQHIIIESANYIETHLKDDLSVSHLASIAGYSLCHYYKLFNLYFDVPVMDYIRRRRLAHAVRELYNGRHILDIAVDYGFETHNGFTKAFHKAYGFPPEEYRLRASPHRPISSNPYTGADASETIRVAPSFRLEHLDGFYIAGLVLCTSSEAAYVSSLPALWQKYNFADTDSKIYGLARPRIHGEYNFCFPSDQPNRFHHVNCVRVDSLDGLDSRLFTEFIPSSLYGVFTTPVILGRPDFAEVIRESWKYILEIWLPDSGFFIHAPRYEFEYYDERCHGDEVFSMDIFVPLASCPLCDGVEYEWL